MRYLRTAVAAIFIAVATSPATAQSASDQIEAVIGAQIDAFRADDFETAFSYASPNIKRMFGSPDRFGSMVQQGYPMVWRPDQVTYLELREIDGRQFQDVMIRDAAGALHSLQYQMINGPEGWQINGVRILELPQIGA